MFGLFEALFKRAPWTRKLIRPVAIIGAFILANLLAFRFGSGGLWHGFDPAFAADKTGAKPKYDLTRLEAVYETLKHIRRKYVDPDRVKPRDMLMSALNYIQRDVAPVIVLPEKTGEVTVRADTHEMRLKVDDVLGPWDVATKLRKVFIFLQKNLDAKDVNFRDIEYAACNGILRTLDPHSVFMSPEGYKEMNLSTSGHFGGLGIVISIRDQLLTIIKPMPNTPAGRAGLKRYDRIMKINNESTLNMPLDDSVRRLRGKPGTKVTVWIARDGADGWQGSRKFVLTRERIRVNSVVARRLEGDIGYVRLKQFQQTSKTEIRRALEGFSSQGELRGIVLDLRGNPGGLLDQSAKVADLFLRRGIIVSTVGHSEGREETEARADGIEPNCPMVVLVNGSSASASEIVAGALKNLGRAIIVGQKTFGKGSVQLVFPDVTRDKAALKLTIAQYLTPGDTSIQGVGVVPHIELDPMTADQLEMDLTIRQSGLRERDLSKHLQDSRAATVKPAQVVRYYLSQKQREDLRERGGELEDEFQLDFPISFASDLARRMPKGVNATGQLRAAGDFIKQTRSAQLDKAEKALAKLGVDWSIPSQKPVPGPTKQELEVKIRTDQAGHEVVAGNTINLEVEVKNNGTVPVYRLRAVTESDNSYYDERELVFGKIAPGESKVASTPLSWCKREGHRVGSTKPKPENAKRVCKIPKDALARSDGLKVHFDAAGGHAPASVELRPTIRALPRPLFQYSYQIADDRSGNGDGLIQKGEQLTMYLTVKNVGAGRSYETQANLANRSGDGVLLRKGRFDISNMKPGDVRKVTFTFDVQPQLRDDEVVLVLSVGDRDLREYATEKLRLPVSKPTPLSLKKGSVSTAKETLLEPDAVGSREAFGKLAAGSKLKLLARAGKFTKVQLAPGRFAFVPTADLDSQVGQAQAAPDRVSFDQIYTHAPPKLTVRTSAMATKKNKVKIKVDAFDTEQLLDMYLYVGARKLYYQSNRQGTDPKRASFEFEAPLRPGVNHITVVARENSDTTTRRTVVVRRDGADGSILKTPKHHEYLLSPLD